MQRLSLLIAALLLPLGGGLARAQGAAVEPTHDRVVYRDGRALRWIEAAGGDSQLLLELPPPLAELEDLQIAASGDAMLLRSAAATAWLELGDAGAGPLRFLPCGGPGHLSSDGNQVACPSYDGEGLVRYDLRPTLGATAIDEKSDGPVHLLGTSGQLLIHVGSQLVSVGDATTLMSSEAPSAKLAVSPDGQRFAAAFPEGDLETTYAIKLNGKGVKRTLVQASYPLRFSANSNWLLVQQQVDACAVRAVGGQYMCWRKYRAVDVSSQGHSILMSRPGEKKGQDLFIGLVGGTKSVKSTRLLTGLDEVLARFWPHPESAAQEARRLQGIPDDAGVDEEGDEGEAP